MLFPAEIVCQGGPKRNAREKIYSSLGGVRTDSIPSLITPALASPNVKHGLIPRACFDDVSSAAVGEPPYR